MNHVSKIAKSTSEVAPRLASGTHVASESFFNGIEDAPTAFIELLRGGAHVGKVVVRLAPEPQP